MSISYYKKYFTKLMVTAIILIIEVNNASNAVQIESNKLCGKKRTEVVSNIVNGTTVTESDYPWDIAVYDVNKNFICGGSLINLHIVLSAANCFTDNEDKVLAKENFYIAGGKYFSHYDDERDRNAQYSEINAIHIPERYNGRINFFASDIALVILSTPFTLSTNIQPICIDLESDDVDFNENNVGIVTGWKVINEQTKELRGISVSYTPYSVCFEGVPHTFRRFITYDKICSAYSNNDTLIHQSSGSPLIFPDKVENNERYFVRGIANSSPDSSTERFNLNPYQIYTSIAKHVNFIKEIVALF